MSRTKLLVSVVVGLMVGQLFAAGDQDHLFKVVNTVRFGYSDNLHRTPEGKGSTFVTDTIDLSFRAAFSDRTDLIIKSQLNLLDDNGGNEIYPNLYAMLNHNVSPRLLLGLSEYYRSGDKSGSGSTPSDGKRYNFFENKVGLSADYVLTGRDRLGFSLDHDILRHDEAINTLDYTTIGGGASWQRELVPQRTQVTFSLNPSRTTYDNLPKDSFSSSTNSTNSVSYLDDQAYYDALSVSAGLSHTFNQQWQGHIEAGVTCVQPNFSDSITTNITTNGVSVKTNTLENAQTISPLLRAGLVYSPSPRTRLSTDFSMSHTPSDDTGYGGQNTTELRFDAQHELTAKLMAKANVRFSSVTYDEQDATDGSSKDKQEDRMDLEFALTYKLNRMHFIEARVQHTEKEYSNGAEGWTENRADIGWRVELN
ncbi:MAG: outer membrane beta-barrel protein [Verrucomicrobia bacterium]|nr:outer membrane beta-barrel protein [Verrucomicrobiota bacterium]